MKTRHALLVGAVLLAGLALVGTATATTAGAQFDESINETTNDTDAPEVGVCMIGVDSPCNGEQWDGDDAGGELTPVEDSETRDGSESEPIKNETNGEDANAGICVIGVDSPCNGAAEPDDPVESASESGNSLLGGLLNVLTTLF